jgi:ribonuclease P protein component
MSVYPATLRKEERLYSKKLIEQLFQGGRSQSMSAFPLRVVFMPLDTADMPQAATTQPLQPQAKVLISVPKRCFKRAVKRNLVKRQVREAYRKHKSLIADRPVAMAFVWLDAHLRCSAEVEGKVVNLLKRVDERLQAAAAKPAEPTNA